MIGRTYFGTRWGAIFIASSQNLPPGVWRIRRRAYAVARAGRLVLALLVVAALRGTEAAPPAGSAVLSLQHQGGLTTLTWTLLPGAPLYDVARGSLSILHATGGGFTEAATSCLQDHRRNDSVVDAESPAAGDGFWYVIRGVNCDGPGTYDTGSPYQVGSRDQELDASGQCVPAFCAPGLDSDEDRLDDCYETGTTLFCGPTNTGTDLFSYDTDGDFIADGDEVLGTLAGLDLPGLGASPLRRDVFLEYDWFEDSLGCGLHSHRPTQAMADRVSAAFAAAPLANMDGTTGISVHHDFGQGGLFTGGNVVPDADGVLTNGVNNAEFRAIKNANFSAKRNGYFHYVLLPHRYGGTTSSGQAELPGDDLIVSLGCGISTVNVGNTIVHEIGHNFGLRHGGFEDCNYKPNYNSVMNYKYQFPGVDTNCTPPGDGLLDYSRGVRINLDENALDEAAGVCGSPSWDWNQSGTIESLAVYDINRDGSGTPQNAGCNGDFAILRDYDDWNSINYSGLLDSDFAFVLIKEIITCDNPPPGEE